MEESDKSIYKAIATMNSYHYNKQVETSKKLIKDKVDSWDQAAREYNKKAAKRTVNNTQELRNEFLQLQNWRPTEYERGVASGRLLLIQPKSDDVSDAEALLRSIRSAINLALCE
jgi:hypothetical protein